MLVLVFHTFLIIIWIRGLASWWWFSCSVSSDGILEVMATRVKWWRCWWYEWYCNLRTAVEEAIAPSLLPIFKERSYQLWWRQIRPYTFVSQAFWTSFLLKNKLNSASQNINFSSFPSPFLWEYITVCKLFLSVLCPSAVLLAVSAYQQSGTIRVLNFLCSCQEKF